MREQLPPLHGGGTIQETTVGEINIAGLPGVTVPAGFYASGAPFNPDVRRSDVERGRPPGARLRLRGRHAPPPGPDPAGRMTTARDRRSTAAMDAYRITSEPYYRSTGGEVALFEAAYRDRLPVMLKGPTGCGKTRFIEHMAWKIGVPLVTVAAHEDMTAADLAGRFLLAPRRHRVARRTR